MNPNPVDLRKILFLDIETVSGYSHYEEMDERGQELWAKKGARQSIQGEAESDSDFAARTYKEKAAIFAEFGQIVCISVGYLQAQESGPYQLKVKSFASELEIEVLEGFAELLNKYFSDPMKNALCGHNIKEFDIPYICRRMLVNRMPLPEMLNMSGKKPWEVKYLLDTLEMWKFGDFKNYTSLDALTWLFGIQSPKGDLDGSMVGHTFWEENDLNRIAEYCNQDIVATARVYFCLNGLDPDTIEPIFIA